MSMLQRRRERSIKVAARRLSERETLRLVVADRYPLFAQAVERILGEQREFEVIARCEDGDAALRAVSLYHPDALVIDVDIPGKDGVSVLREIRAMSVATRVVLLAHEMSEAQIIVALRSSVDGIVLKTATPDTLVDCVRKATAGTQWLEPQVLRRLVDRLVVAAPPAQAETVLTRAEQKILHLVGDGLVNKEIAGRLTISEGTVKNHLHNVYVKLGITGRREVVRHAREAGYLKQVG